MIDVAVRKRLLVAAEKLALELGRFRTPGSGDAVDPSRVEELSRFVRQTGSVDDLDTFLTLLPTSFHARMSRSAPPQIQEIVRLVRPLKSALGITTADEMIYLLTWTRRLLATAERGGGTSRPEPRSPARPPYRGAGPGGRR